MRARGQTLVLVALTLLLLTVMVCMTLSIGTAAARKADLANAADAAAFSNATATARSFNTAALLNRTIVSHYVAMAGVQAQMAYASTVHKYFHVAGNMFRMYDVADFDPIDMNAVNNSNNALTTGCALRTTEVRDASYEMWHAALSALSPAPGSPLPGDNANGFCQRGVCSAGRPWLRENLALLEEDAADQASAIHDAIWDLARIEHRTYDNLKISLNAGTYAEAIADAAGVGARVVGGKVSSVTELDDATANSLVTRPISFQRPFAEAVLGTRRRREPLLLPTIPENLPPLTTQLKAQTDAAFAAYPQQPFSVSFSATEVSADYSFQGDMQRMIEDPLIVGTRLELHPAMDYSFGRALEGSVSVTYRDACLRRIGTTLVSGNTAGTPQPGRPGVMMYAPKMEEVIRSDSAGGHHLDGMHWDLGPNGGGCHGSHQHYHWTQADVHKLRSPTLPAEVLAFVLPDNSPNPDLKGARGLWGQPVIPVVLSQQHDPAKDPFNLTFRFRFSPDGQRFDMRAAVDRVLAPAAGIAYYHRRGHLGEPPNLLNPFWHATLVPLEIDERKDGSDPTQASQALGSRMASLISATSGYRQKANALQAYAGLKDQITGLTKTPQLSDP